MQNSNTTSQELTFPPAPLLEDMKPANIFEWFGFNPLKKHAEAMNHWQHQCQMIINLNSQIQSYHANNNETDSSNGSSSVPINEGKIPTVQEQPTRDLNAEIQEIINSATKTMSAQLNIIKGRFTAFKNSNDIEKWINDLISNENEDDINYYTIRALGWCSSSRTSKERVKSYQSMQNRLNALNDFARLYFARSFDEIIGDAYDIAVQNIAKTIRHHVNGSSDDLAPDIEITSFVYQDIFVGELLKQIECEERNSVFDDHNKSDEEAEELYKRVKSLRAKLTEIMLYMKRLTNNSDRTQGAKSANDDNEKSLKNKIPVIVSRPASYNDDAQTTKTKQSVDYTLKTIGRVAKFPRVYWTGTSQNTSLTDIKNYCIVKGIDTESIPCIRVATQPVTPRSEYQSIGNSPEQSTPYSLGDVSPVMSGAEHSHAKSNEFENAKAGVIAGDENSVPNTYQSPNSLSFLQKNDLA